MTGVVASVCNSDITENLQGIQKTEYRILRYRKAFTRRQVS
jgi:hypothetical protein